MPVYSDLRFFDSAVESILAQSFQDFEFIIVNDGAGSLDVFARAAARDARIRVVTNTANKGVSAAANRGIHHSRGEIIARLDADDIARPNWIDCLVAALDADPDLGLVGANLVDIDERGAKTRSRSMPETDIAIRWAMLFCNPFCHSSVCFRRTCYDRAGGYDESWRATGDYEFWFRMLSHCRAANIQQELIEYRVNPRGITATYLSTWRERNDPLRERSWAQLGAAYDPAIADALSAFVLGFDIPAIELRIPAYHACLELLQRFLATSRPFARAEDNVDIKRLVQDTVDRIVADPMVRDGPAPAPMSSHAYDLKALQRSLQSRKVPGA